MKVLFCILTVIALSGCASFKGKVSNTDNFETKSDNSVNVDSLVKTYQSDVFNLQLQLRDEKELNRQNNIVTKTTEEYAQILQQGGETTGGKRADNLISVSTETHIGRIKATSTYFYKNDSIVIDLHVGDTTISIRKTIKEKEDHSIVQTAESKNSNSSQSDNKTAVQTTDKQIQEATQSDKKSQIKTTASFGASIGLSNWWPAVISGLVFLFIGIVVGKKIRHA